MAASPHVAKLAAYSSASAHGGVAAADPHRLIVMLMDGALERIASARGCMERNDIGGKAQLLNRAIQIIGELRGSLDVTKGAEIAANLDALYDYMGRRLLEASLRNDTKMLDEVTKLLRDLRDAWSQIPKEALRK
jgi:flagellar protein FliS